MKFTRVRGGWYIDILCFTLSYHSKAMVREWNRTFNPRLKSGLRLKMR